MQFEMFNKWHLNKTTSNKSLDKKNLKLFITINNAYNFNWILYYSHISKLSGRIIWKSSKDIINFFIVPVKS